MKKFIAVLLISSCALSHAMEEPPSSRKALAKKTQELFEAIKANEIAKIDQLLSGADKEALLKNQGKIQGVFYTPLLLAVVAGNIPVIEKLIELGANVNQPNKDGVTPLLEAGARGKIPIIEKLIELGANVNQPLKHGVTLLLEAVGRGKIPIIEKLIELGANVNQPNKDGVTPLIFAVIKENLLIVKHLIKHGANVNQPNKNGFTPLTWAVMKENLLIVNELLNSGAFTEIFTHHGKTPKQVAQEGGHTEIVNLIKQAEKRIEKGEVSCRCSVKGITPEKAQPSTSRA